MIEVMDRNTGNKMMMLMFGKIIYQEESYAIYCIRRGKDEVNIFVSKLVRNSGGYVLDDNFLNGEKEIMEGIVRRLLNHEPIQKLELDGFSLNNKITLNEGQIFDIKKCYVTTVSKKLIKDCMIYYGLIEEYLLNNPVIEVKDEKGYFNKGFVSNIGLIIFGIIVLIFCLIMIGSILF